MKPFILWLGLLGVLASWELALADPGRVLYWLLGCLVAASVVSLKLSDEEGTFQSVLVDRIAAVLFSVGALWWFLWLDFAYAKFAAPVLVWLVLAYASTREQTRGRVSPTVRLMLFFGGTFFWAVTSFGLLSVIGWEVWETLAVFGASFAAFAYAGVHTLGAPRQDTFRAHLALVLLGLELFSVVAWLPFTETTLALILVVLALFGYDFIKYYLYPDLIRKRIIIKKVALYALFLIVVLVSTPWV